MRLVLTGDLHGYLPPVQTCDVLLIAGDVCPIQSHKLDFQADWLKWTFIPWLRRAPARQKIFTHMNNTNPILRPGSRERAQVEQAGIVIARDGLEIVL